MSKDKSEQTAKEFIDGFLSEEQAEIKENTSVVLALMKSSEIDAILEEIIEPMMDDDPDMQIEDHGSYWWIKKEGKIEIDLSIGSEIVGKDYNVFDFLVNVTTTVGRTYTNGDMFVLTSELIGLETDMNDTMGAK